MAPETHETRYVSVDGTNVAYQVFGKGPLDLVFFAGSFNHVDVWWDHPIPAGLLRAFASFSRLILFDRRGTGASDPLPTMEVPHWRTWTADLGAVLDAVGAHEAALFASLDAGPPALAYAAAHPERVTKLVLFNTSARLRRAADYPCGLEDEVADRLFDSLSQGWGTEAVAKILYPDRGDDSDFLRWNARYQRASCSPGRARAFARAWFDIDARDIVSQVTTPTLVIQREHNAIIPEAQGQWLVRHLSNAVYSVAPGSGGLFSRDVSDVIDQVCRFLTDQPYHPPTIRPVVANAPSVAGHCCLRLLGRGGMGEVWEAVHEATGARVAVKVLGLRATPALRKRLEREAEMTRAMQHPAAVRVLELAQTNDGSPAIVMELLEGETLAEKLARDGPATNEEAVSLLLPIVSAIGSAHALGIVHRDLKPANVFLERQGTQLRARLLDFGIAKALREDGDTTRLTASGVLIGTPSYMAPEQLFGDPTDHHADIWALGLIIYETLTGTLPAGQVLKLAMGPAQWDPRERTPTVPADLAVIVARMLTADPSGRPDMYEVFRALAEHGPEKGAAPDFDPPGSRAFLLARTLAAAGCDSP
ncbi:MAG: alpha/beta fold hydrolase [Polyangiaceae bacterium]